MGDVTLKFPSDLANAVAAHASPDGLRATLDAAPIGLAQFDLEGRFLFVNDRLCEILGFTRADLVGHTFQEISFPDDLPRCLELTAALAAGTIPSYSLEKRFVRPGGSAVWARITASALRHPDGRVAFFIGAAEDITAQVETTQALRTAEERLRTALGASMIGTFRFDLRRNALEWADGLERVFGGLGQVTLDEFFAVIHPDDRPHMMAAYTRSVTEGVDLEEEFRVTWPDGSTHWLHDRGRTLPGDDGRPHWIVGAITDITNHKRMEEVIGEREAQFRTLANTIPQLAWIADSDGRRSWYNDRWCDYTGCTLEELRNYGWMRVHVSEEMAATVLAEQRAAFQAGAAWENTVRLRRKDGQYRWFLSRAMPVRGADGAVTQWIGSNTDITDRLEKERALQARETEREEVLRREQQARSEAEHATALRQQVLGYVAHDLRNPLQAVVMAASALLDLPLSPEQRIQRIELIKRCAREMDRLIADLLDVSRIDAGTFAVQHDRVAVAPLLAEVIEGFQEQARTREVTLASDVAAEVGTVEGDSRRLTQALSNLVNNALKFTPAGGRVTLAARAHGNQIEVTVADTGCGIAPESLPSIFDRFWQANRTAGGAGLGLAIVKGIIHSHGGQVHVESTPGQGTTFRVRLPTTDS